jgi:hypothetical protein
MGGLRQLGIGGPSLLLQSFPGQPQKGIKELFKGDELFFPNASQVILAQSIVPGFPGRLDHLSEDSRPGRQVRVSMPDAACESPGAPHIQSVPLETLLKDFLVVPRTILSPCGHPPFDLLGIFATSFDQEITAQALLEKRRAFHDFPE